MTLDDALFVKLQSLGEVGAHIEGRLYRGWRPQGAALPCVTCFRVDTQVIQGATGRTNTERARFQLDVWASNQRTARQIADMIKQSLDGWSSESSPATSQFFLEGEQCIQEEAVEDDEKPEQRITQDYCVWYYAS